MSLHYFFRILARLSKERRGGGECIKQIQMKYSGLCDKSLPLHTTPMHTIHVVLEGRHWFNLGSLITARFCFPTVIKKSRRYIPDVLYVSRDSQAAEHNAYYQETADEIQRPVDVVICNPNYD